MFEQVVFKERRQKTAALDAKIQKALEEMLEDDINITFRATVRAVDGLLSASSITRDDFRRELVARYQAMQVERRRWSKRVQKSSSSVASDILAAKQLQIAELEKQVQVLTASHKAMILAVGELGGMEGWSRFFEDYEAGIKVLADLDAI